MINVNDVQNYESSDSLALDFGEREPVHHWRRLIECDEFVGSRRSKHTIVAYKNFIYIFGGDNGKQMLNDFLIFDLDEVSWSRASIRSGYPPTSRYHHSAVVYNKSMFIFGGYTDGQYNYTNCNDLYEYKFSMATWCKWEISGTKPVPRSAHGCAVFDDKLWIFAGYDGKLRLNDMWTLPLNTLHPAWEEVIQIGECPPTCCNFAMAVARDSMFVFSGQSGAKMANDLFRFHFNTRCWHRILISEHILRNAPPPPTRRYGHTMVAFEGFLYVFGGAADSTLPSHLHSFDLDEQIWSVVKTTKTSEVPSCRLFHSATVIGDCMYVFGGTVDNNVRSSELFRFRFSNYPKCTLRNDFGTFLQNKQLCDIEFCLEDNSTGEEILITAHISFVAPRSKYLQNIIQNTLYQEDENNGKRKKLRIELKNINPQAFVLVLNYIYTDQIDSSKVMVEPLNEKMILLMTDVYTLALQFQMSRLENICVQFLNTAMNINNVLIALENASKLNLNFLKKICMKFIVKDSNYSRLIMTKEFEKLPKQLMIEIIRRKELPNLIQSASSINSSQFDNHNSFAILNLMESTNIEFSKLNINDQSLEEDMKVFFNDDKFYDICLILDGHEIKSHKAILAARSKYFEALFRSFMPEDDRINIQIGDIKPTLDAFQSLLKYIYYGETNVPVEHSLYLYSAPNYYGFTNNRFQIFSKHNLEWNVNEENVLRILIAADRLNMSEMKQYAFNLIVQNFDRVAKHEDLKELDKQLLLEIIKYTANEFETITRPLRTGLA